MTNKQLKILHLPYPWGGHSQALRDYERKNGYKSLQLSREQDFRNYDVDITLFEKKFRTSFMGTIYYYMKIFLWLLSNTWKFNLFHFNGGETLLNTFPKGKYFIDLPLYKFFGKIIVTYNGSDARLIANTSLRNKYYKGLYSKLLNTDQINKQDKFIKDRIKKMDQYANLIFTVNPDLKHNLPERTKFIPYLHNDWSKIKKINYHRNDKNFRIVHAPTNRGIKGTIFLIKAVETLSKKYSNIELILVEGKKHKEAIKIYETADVIVDQLILGWYGSLGLEVMKMGLPLMVYIHEPDLIFIPNSMKKQLLNSVINVNPENITEKLEFIIKNQDILNQYSNLGYEYVMKWHDPKYVMNLLDNIYK